MFTKAYIPYRAYYSTPFSKWQMTLANEHAFELAGRTAGRWLQQKGISPANFDYLYLGFTVHQRQGFYGAPWVAALLGAAKTPGCNVSQACSTGTTCLYNAAVGIEAGVYQRVLTVMADRCSNSPHIVWPNPSGPGGMVIQENWFMDNVESDPHAKYPMIGTGENVARSMGATKAECDELAARRYEQYAMALADDRAFQKRYMFPVEARLGPKKTVLLEADEGVIPTSLEVLTKMRPVVDGGVHSFGAQTHPADANACIVVTTEQEASALSADPAVKVRIASYGFARAEKGYMPAAPVPAAAMALERAGIKVGDLKAVKTHNPFAVNDLYLLKELGPNPGIVNNYGSSIVYGHPQAPTAARAVIELIEEIVDLGGGYGLFTGCAAGDTGAALVIKVGA
ncbi:MAG: thiolase family protein [Deltaproteobacteria bacterium]|nr:thiolase family protein [Deltaproteobacteria bacterium]